VGGTIKVSSFERFRDQEADEWGDIADRLEGASELTIKEPLTVTEHSSELEMINRANIGLGMFEKFIEVSGGGTANFAPNIQFVHTLPNWFLYCASFGELEELTAAMCVDARRRYDACVKIMSLAELQRRIFEAALVKGINAK
jgi:hypothetical protein